VAIPEQISKEEILQVAEQLKRLEIEIESDDVLRQPQDADTPPQNKEETEPSAADLYRQFAQDAKSHGRAASVKHEEEDSEQLSPTSRAGLVSKIAFLEHALASSLDLQRSQSDEIDRFRASPNKNLGETEREVKTHLRDALL